MNIKKHRDNIPGDTIEREVWMKKRALGVLSLVLVTMVLTIISTTPSSGVTVTGTCCTQLTSKCVLSEQTIIDNYYYKSEGPC